MNRLNIITPTCIRDIELLPLMVESCKTDLFDVKLWIAYDYLVDKFLDELWIDERCIVNPSSFKGRAQRNSIINDIPEGEFICYMDTDNKVHESFFERIKWFIETHPNIDCFYFWQDRCDGNLMKADGSLCPCRIDGHQIVYKNNKILWTDEPASDGIILKQIYEYYKNSTLFIDEVLSYHNKLVDGKVQ